MCIYCTISDAHYGGIRNFHVEHYRPKSRFKGLEHIYSNLFYACAICNTFKGNDWPDEPKPESFDYIHYPDPSVTDYSKLFVVDPDTAMVSGVNVAARYLVEQLHLNRPQILRNRKLLLLGGRLAQVREALAMASREHGDIEDLKQAIELVAEISRLFEGFWLGVPYDATETRQEPEAA